VLYSRQMVAVVNDPDFRNALTPGKPLGKTDWIKLDQDLFTDFETLTRSNDPLHTDPDWVRRHTDFPSTIAPGFLTLSLLPFFYAQLDATPKGYHAVNYGLNRVRWIAPIPVGASARAHFTCVDVNERSHGRPGSIVEFDVTVETRGAETPAMQALWLGALIPDSP